MTKLFELKATIETEKKVEKILSGCKAEREKLIGMIEEESQGIPAAFEAMDAATASGNLEAYQAAKKKRADLIDAKEMHEKRLKDLNEKPLISKAEYEEAVAGIYAEFASFDDKAKAKLRELSDQMYAVSIELAEATSRANDVLTKLQTDVYRDADRTRSGKGNIIPMATETKAVNKWDTISWGQTGVKSPQYQTYTGRKVR